MQFASANPSVVRSIKQRELLNAWLRARAEPRPRALPHVGDYQPDRFVDEMTDMMGFDVAVSGNAARFFITQEGATLAVTYGSEDVAPGERTNRFLDDAIGPERYARVLPPYRACLARKRPTYSICTVLDADGKDVAYERLLLPFGTGDAVEQIVGSYKAISIEGRFKRNNLMGIRPSAVPVEIVNAIIDLDFIRPVRGRSDEIVELD
jgi:hypothetical protein